MLVGDDDNDGVPSALEDSVPFSINRWSLVPGGEGNGGELQKGCNEHYVDEQDRAIVAAGNSFLLFGEFKRNCFYMN